MWSDERWKVARRCGTKNISKSKCTKHTNAGPLLEVVMSKRCTPLWREAHFEVKMYKAPGVRSTFRSCDVEKVHAVVARSTFRSQKCKKLTGSDRFWTFSCRDYALAKSEHKVRVLWRFLKRWRAWDICRRSGKMHFAWQAQYKRHVHQRC